MEYNDTIDYTDFGFWLVLYCIDTGGMMVDAGRKTGRVYHKKNLLQIN